MIAQLNDFRTIPDDACILNEETTNTLSYLLESSRLSQQLFEFKLLEKEKVFPGEKFNLKTSQINKALNSVDMEREDLSMNIDLEEKLKALTIQEELIERRDLYNKVINRKIEEEEADLSNKFDKDVNMKKIEEEDSNLAKNRKIYYNLEEIGFDEEKTVKAASVFLNNLHNHPIKEEVEEENLKENIVFNKQVMKNRMKNDDERQDLKKMQEKIGMLSFYDELE